MNIPTYIYMHTHTYTCTYTHIHKYTQINLKAHLETTNSSRALPRLSQGEDEVVLAKDLGQGLAHEPQSHSEQLSIMTVNLYDCPRDKK